MCVCMWGVYMHACVDCQRGGRYTKYQLAIENVEHCGGEPEQAANMHMNRLSFMLLNQ